MNTQIHPTSGQGKELGVFLQCPSALLFMMEYFSWASKISTSASIVCYGKMPFSLLPPSPLFFDRFSQKMVPCTVSCSEQCSCSWDVGQQRICNITVTVQNPLGRKTATDVFDVTHRSKVFSMSLLKVFLLQTLPFF